MKWSAIPTRELHIILRAMENDWKHGHALLSEIEVEISSRPVPIRNASMEFVTDRW